MMRTAARVLALGLATGALGGCAALAPPLSQNLVSGVAEVRDCARWFTELDERVDAAGVRDEGAAPVAGFPYLRVNRLLASFRPSAGRHASALEGLVERMRALDLEARRYELMNLPAGAIDPGGTHGFAAVREALQRTDGCGRTLQQADSNPEARALLLERARVPDDYSVFKRALGLYPLTRHLFSAGIARYEEETRAAFARSAAAPGAAPRAVRFAPQPGGQLPRSRVALILERSAQNPLGIPEPSEAELRELLTAYAPSLEVDVAGDHDRFGALFWDNVRNGAAPAVDASRPAAYGHAAWARYGDRSLLQLVYTFWFPERPPAAAGDLLAGRLDGLVWRVTLAPDGEPLLYDAMHSCGCFHQFFPTPLALPLPAPEGAGEWLFAPQTVPRAAAGERALLKVSSATHMIEQVSLVRGTDSLVRYEILPYGQLRSLPRGGGRAGVFGPGGLVAGTERGERYLFWPTGIDSAGAMRQWGRHATAFVGRRHFDDADLLERRFRLELP